MAEIGKDIVHAKQLLTEGQVVGIPTETVYGLAGNALNEAAILKIYEVKNRPKFDPLIAHTDSIEKVVPLVKSIPEAARKLVDILWPGPLTLLLEKSKVVPDLLTSGHDRVAVRIPNHELTLRLLKELSFPLAAPSANPFGYVSPVSAAHVEKQLGAKIPYILDGGECRVGVESTIIGFEEGRATLYRLGGVSLEQIERIIGKVEIRVNVSSDPAAPGMLKSHYSPGRKMIVGDISQNLAEMNDGSIGIISFSQSFDVPDERAFVLSPSGDLNEAARNIFKALRKMDHPAISTVLTEYVPDHGIGQAINDRIRRASV